MQSMGQTNLDIERIIYGPDYFQQNLLTRKEGGPGELPSLLSSKSTAPMTHSWGGLAGLFIGGLTNDPTSVLLVNDVFVKHIQALTDARTFPSSLPALKDLKLRLTVLVQNAKNYELWKQEFYSYMPLAQASLGNLATLATEAEKVQVQLDTLMAIESEVTKLRRESLTFKALLPLLGELGKLRPSPFQAVAARLQGQEISRDALFATLDHGLSIPDKELCLEIFTLLNRASPHLSSDESTKLKEMGAAALFQGTTVTLKQTEVIAQLIADPTVFETPTSRARAVVGAMIHRLRQGWITPALTDRSSIEGLFRMQGSESQIRSLVGELGGLKPEQRQARLAAVNDCHVLAKGMSRMCSELPAKVIPSEYYEFLKTADDKVAALRQVIDTLPPENRELLKEVALFLHELAAHYQDATKMGSANLAICWGPALIQVPQTTDPASMVEQTTITNSVVQLLIEKAPALFA